MLFTLDNAGMGPIDWKKVLTHTIIFFVGYGLMAGIEYLLKLNFGMYTAPINLFGGTVVNIIQKYLDGVKE